MIRTGRKNRVMVPRDLDSVTTIRSADEVDPQQVGLQTKNIDRIWRSVRGFYQLGLHPAMTLVLRRRGQVVMSRGIGHAMGNGPGETGVPPILATPDSPACLFSGSKAVTAMLIHKLAETGALNLDDRVAAHIPDFARNGKENTTILHLLTHRAGIATIPIKDPDPSLLFDFDFMVKLLCATGLDSHPGDRQAYHAVTSGYILGEVARRASGKSLQELIREVLAAPLGCTAMSYGLPEEQRSDYAKSWSTGPDHVPVVSQLVKRVLGAEASIVAPALETPEGLSAVIPAANIYASAEDMCRFFQMLLQGGQWNDTQVFRPETVAAATRPAGPLTIDSLLMVPVRFSAGFVLGEWPVGLYGLNTANAFGHLGFLHILCWADPARDISCSFLSTGKSISPEGFIGFANVIRTVSQQCSVLGSR